MIIDRTKQINRAMAILLSVVIIIALSVSIAGTFCEADCNDDCQEESGTCCACICCPSNVVMTLSDSHTVQIEYLTCLWTLSRAGVSGEQEWFTNIDYPPRDLT